MTDLTITPSSAPAMVENIPATPPEKPSQPRAASSSQPGEPAPTPATDAPRQPIDEQVKGYPRMAAHMGLIPETAMFRRFGALNFRNLLYFQSELATIEDDLNELEWEDNKSPMGKKQDYVRDYYWLGSATAARDGDAKQRELVMKLRETLDRYNHAIIQQHTILKMMPPDAYDVKTMQRFMCSEKMNYNTVLKGCDMDIWGTIIKKDSHSKDLVVLREREGPDSFSRQLSSIAVPFIKWFAPARGKKPDPDYGVITVRDDRIFKLTAYITSMIASIVPVICIVVVVKVESVAVKLGAIVVSNVLISLCLLYFTEAKRKDIFAITVLFTTIHVMLVNGALRAVA